jgi:hypothetical protein
MDECFRSHNETISNGSCNKPSTNDGEWLQPDAAAIGEKGREIGALE